MSDCYICKDSIYSNKAKTYQIYFGKLEYTTVRTVCGQRQKVVPRTYIIVDVCDPQYTGKSCAETLIEGYQDEDSTVVEFERVYSTQFDCLIMRAAS